MPVKIIAKIRNTLEVYSEVEVIHDRTASRRARGVSPYEGYAQLLVWVYDPTLESIVLAGAGQKLGLIDEDSGFSIECGGQIDAAPSLISPRQIIIRPVASQIGCRVDEERLDHRGARCP